MTAGNGVGLRAILGSDSGAVGHRAESLPEGRPVGTNADVVSSAIEAFNSHDYEAFGANLADDATFSDMPAGVNANGRDEVVEYAKGWHAGFSDARLTHPKLIEADGSVVAQFVGTGTQSAEFGPGPFPNNGGSFEMNAIQVYSLNDDHKVTNVDLYYDTMTMLTQLGHIG